MRETAFIQQNEQKWKEFEQLLDGGQGDPEKLNDLFVQVTDDLSFARTFYPNRSVRVYLNGLAQRIFFTIYKGKKSKRSRFAEFWADDLPLLLYQARPDLLLSLIVFVVAMAIGMLSCQAEAGFLEGILGESYVEMTKENIAKGDPMAVYKDSEEMNMFFGITMNNLFVALQTFLFGVFYAIGTVGCLIYNGIMLGAFQYFFIEQGLFRESFLTVWMHGAFEISSIVIAGAAGLTMGRGLVFPGTMSRMRSFQQSSRRGLSIMVGTVPLFILAGFTESFLTRYTDLPDVVRGGYIFTCMAFVVFYFVIYPKIRVGKGMANLGKEMGLTPDVERRIDFSSVKNTGELFTDTLMLFFREKFRPIALVAAIGALLYIAGAYLLARVGVLDLFQYSGDLFGTMKTLPTFFSNEGNPWLFPLMVVAMTSVAFTVHWVVLVKEKEATEEGFAGKSPVATLFDLLKTLVVVLLVVVIIALTKGFSVLILFLAFQSLFLWSQAMVSEDRGLAGGLSRSFQLSNGTYGQMMGLAITLMVCGILFFGILDTGILYMLINYVSMNFFTTEAQGEVFTTVLFTFIAIFTMLLIFGLWVMGAGLQYYSNLEVVEANALRERIEGIHTRRVIRGLEREG